MDWANEWWVLILGPGLVILVVGILYFTRSRAFTFRSAAAQVGLIALEGLNPISDDEKKRFELFSGGSEGSGGAGARLQGKVSNLFGDRINLPSRLLFDFAYTSSLPQGGVQSQTVAAFRATDRVPDFQIFPASEQIRGTSRDTALATSSEGLDSHPDFASKYQLRAGNEAAAGSFFHSSLLHRLAVFDSGSGWSIEKRGPWLVVYRSGVLTRSQEIPEMWNRAQALANLFFENA